MDNGGNLALLSDAPTPKANNNELLSEWFKPLKKLIFIKGFTQTADLQQILALHKKHLH